MSLENREIVVGVDGSEQSLGALRWAAREARRRSAPLHIVTAYSMPLFVGSTFDAGYAAIDEAALDRAVRAVEEHGLAGPADEWRSWRDRLRRETDERGVAADGSFRQTYDADEVDASLLRIPHTGYCAYDDDRMLATVARIERELVDDEGFVHRYRTSGDGLGGQESSFLICTFWLVEQYARSGRRDDASALMDKLLAVRSDLGLLAEEYDTSAGHSLGNYPQAFSHLALIRACDALG